jgi:hypothetical protein
MKSRFWPATVAGEPLTQMGEVKSNPPLICTKPVCGRSVSVLPVQLQIHDPVAASPLVNFDRHGTGTD